MYIILQIIVYSGSVTDVLLNIFSEHILINFIFIFMSQYWNKGKDNNSREHGTTIK